MQPFDDVAAATEASREQTEQPGIRHRERGLQPRDVERCDVIRESKVIDLAVDVHHAGGQDPDMLDAIRARVWRFFCHCTPPAESYSATRTGACPIKGLFAFSTSLRKWSLPAKCCLLTPRLQWA